MKKIFIFALLACSLASCAITDVIRYDSNSSTYKRQHGIHQAPARCQSGPNSGVYHKR